MTYYAEAVVINRKFIKSQVHQSSACFGLLLLWLREQQFQASTHTCCGTFSGRNEIFSCVKEIFLLFYFSQSLQPSQGTRRTISFRCLFMFVFVFFCYSWAGALKVDLPQSVHYIIG
jgi:hypothetical protein